MSWPCLLGGNETNGGEASYLDGLALGPYIFGRVDSWAKKVRNQFMSRIGEAGGCKGGLSKTKNFFLTNKIFFVTIEKISKIGHATSDI
jgi:hypothetical protein